MQKILSNFRYCCGLGPELWIRETHDDHLMNNEGDLWHDTKMKSSGIALQIPGEMQVIMLESNQDPCYNSTKINTLIYIYWNI